MTRLASLGVAVAAVLLAVGSPSQPGAGGATAEVVVLLDSPPLARAPGTGARVDDEQRAFRHELAAQIPEARLGWRYRLVANGYSVTLPAGESSRLRSLPGVRDVLPTAPRTRVGAARRASGRRATAR